MGTDITPEQMVAAFGALVIMLGQVAAILGKPRAVEAVKILSMVWDVLAANYGKAKNKD